MMNFKKNKSEDLLSGSKDKEITSLEEQIKDLQMILELEKEDKEIALLKNKEGFLNFQMSLICLTQVFVLVTHYGAMQYISWPLTFLLLVVILEKNLKKLEKCF